MKGKKRLCGEFCNYYCQKFVVIVVFLPKQMTNLINYSSWMTTMSSFRLKIYFNGSVQLSMSILRNTLVIFLQHQLKIRMIPSPAKHKQTKTTQQQIQSHLKKIDVSRFSVVSNQGIQEPNSVAVNKNTPRSAKQWINELPKLAGDSTAILKIFWNKWRGKNLTRSWVLSSMTRSQKETEMIANCNPLKSSRVPLNGIFKRTTIHWASCTRRSFTTQKKSIAELH